MDKKISQLTDATMPLTGTELIPIVQSGQTVKATIDDVRGYKVYTAMFSQYGGTLNLVQLNYPDSLTIGVTYEILGGDTNYDFTNVGAPNNNIGTKFAATGTTPNSWGELNSAVLEYDTGAPVVNVLENTIGNIWWTYITVGLYAANSDGLFPVDKVYIDAKQIFGGQVYVNLYEDMEESTLPNQLSVANVQSDGTLVNLVDLARVEIRVYN